MRAVAERAGVNERTVYRHFGNERGLRDAVMHRLEEEAGIVLEAMRLDDVADVAARIFEHVSSYPLEPRPPLDPTLVDANRRQRRRCWARSPPSAEGWSETDRRIAAAMLDVLWSVATFERLVADWQLDRAAAIRGATWVIGLIAEAVSSGRPPGATERGLLQHEQCDWSTGDSTFQQLLAEAEEAPVDGWHSRGSTDGPPRSGLPGATAEAPPRGSTGPARFWTSRPAVGRSLPRC